MNVLFSRRAEKRFDALDAWWRTNRDKAPDLFDREVAAAIERLSHAPLIGTFYKRSGGHEIHRVLLKKTHQYMYYRVHHDVEVVEVITIWGASRRRGPKL